MVLTTPPGLLPRQRFNSELSGVLLPWGVRVLGGWNLATATIFCPLFPPGQVGFPLRIRQCRSSACLSPVSRLPTCLSVKAITSGLRAKTASLTLRMRSNRYPDRAHGAFFFFGFQDLGQVPPPPISDLANYLDARGHTRLTFSLVMPADASVNARGPTSPLTRRHKCLSTIGT